MDRSIVRPAWLRILLRGSLAERTRTGPVRRAGSAHGVGDALSHWRISGQTVWDRIVSAIPAGTLQLVKARPNSRSLLRIRRLIPVRLLSSPATWLSVVPARASQPTHDRSCTNFHRSAVLAGCSASSAPRTRKFTGFQAVLHPGICGPKVVSMDGCWVVLLGSIGSTDTMMSIWNSSAKTWRSSGSSIVPC